VEFIKKVLRKEKEKNRNQNKNKISNKRQKTGCANRTSFK
jgi:hypothetical protein